eukprot:CAMPEP_0177705722 /NCGR_PEP_ID=MMETSP0484_2-20121128/8855_1 /TAXON_ID=354590 /ORGANISM="Rhodomonas lens, Strain RHODO" /LENGTH=569 /DNA_ID=CAMNT_0019217159 /DNA_START=241 /DNA_END=1950 /DNA_ORIENTATION=-
MLCFAFAAELGYASDPAAESDITQRLRAPPFDFSRSAAACANLSNIQTCLGQNGCAWCKGAAGIADACRRWEECTGPGQLCELRKNETFCAAKLSRAEQTGKGACTWCPSEQRCVPAFSVPGQQSQQCRGCDGKFDSAALVDLCGTCGGECHDERIQHIDNKHLRCPCAGCDGIPNSGVAFDTCGVCGGNNRSCLGFTDQEKIGIGLALGGNILISVSLNTQKYAHNQNAVQNNPNKSYLGNPIWWLGLVLMAFGETGNFLAYAYAPATIVAPLGATAVISNTLLAHYVLREALLWKNLMGVGLAIVGAVFIVLFAPSSDRELTMDVLVQYMSERSFIAFVALILICLTGLFLLKEPVKRRYVIVYTLICSLTGSLTVMCIKGVSTALILTINGNNQFNQLLPWLLVTVVIFTLIIQLRYLNLAMIHFGASEVVPVYYVLFTFCSIVAGIVLYQEYHQHCPPNNPDCHYTLYFIFGCLVTFFGVYLITIAKKRADYRDDLDEMADSVLTGGIGIEREGLLVREGSVEAGSRDDLADLEDDEWLSGTTSAIVGKGRRGVDSDGIEMHKVH